MRSVEIYTKVRYAAVGTSQVMGSPDQGQSEPQPGQTGTQAGQMGSQGQVSQSQPGHTR